MDDLIKDCFDVVKVGGFFTTFFMDGFLKFLIRDGFPTLVMLMIVFDFDFEVPDGSWCVSWGFLYVRIGRRNNIWSRFCVGDDEDV